MQVRPGNSFNFPLNVAKIETSSGIRTVRAREERRSLNLSCSYASDGGANMALAGGGIQETECEYSFRGFQKPSKMYLF